MTVTLHRHVGYVFSGANAGMMKVADLNLPICGEALDYTMGHRQIGYTSSGMAKLATALKCCYVVSECDKVETDCWYPTGGIRPKMLAVLQNVANCETADRALAVLTYCGVTSGGSGECAYSACGSESDPDDPCLPSDYATRGKWVGSVVLRGGTLGIEVWCQDGDPDALPTPIPPTLYLRLKGCAVSGETVSICPPGTVQCYDPILATFPDIALPDCCDCSDTDEAAEITIHLIANCYPVTMARHIGYDWATGKALVSIENCKNVGEVGCCLPTCGMSYEISNVSGCACLEVSGTLEYSSVASAWIHDGFSACSNVVDLQMTCTPIGTTGTTTLTLQLTCGVTTTAQDSVVVDCVDLEDLDVTFTLAIDGSPDDECSDGDCRWQYNEMSATWDVLADTCPSEDCDDCPNSPASPPGSPSDGQIHTEPCTGTIATECCVGTITVRVRRV